MPLIKTVLLFVLLGVIGLGGVYVAENHGLVATGTFANLIQKGKALPTSLQLAQIKSPQQAASFLAAQTASITSQTAKIGTESGNVLGTVSNVANNVSLEKQDAPLTQRAFEYGRYIYCQQVVNDYQSRYPNSTPTSK